mmetsp:Transcript_36899/g.63699  ORF Transcript_36899/g.63699 Transcript_36899/m.63699 type:complete len:420 (-) Transcript_36899:2862-4121(-)
MCVVQAEALLHQLHELGGAASTLVVADELLQVIRVHDDVQTADVGQAELLGTQTSEVHFLPGGGAVGLGGSIHGLAVLLQVDVAEGQLGVVVDVNEQQLRGLEQTLVEAALADLVDLGHVGHTDYLLELSQLVHLGQGVDELSVHQTLLHQLAGHLQVSHQVLELVGTLGGVDHQVEITGIIGLHVGTDGLRDEVVVELRLGKLAPHILHVHALGELLGAVQVADVVHQHLDGRHMVTHLLVALGLLAELDVDGQGLLVQAVLLLGGDLGDIRTVEVVETVDVLHDLLLVAADGSQDQQVLEVLVARELTALQHDALQQLDQLLRHVAQHEGLHRGAHLVRVLGLGQRGLHHLIQQVAATGRLGVTLVEALGLEHLLPQFQVLLLHEVAGQVLEQTVLLGHLHQLRIALASGVLVGDEG